MVQILIADDEASIRTILTKAMEQKGYEVLRASTGAQALEYLKNSPIDVALVDIRMPDVTGLEILDHQKNFPSAPAIFVITAQDTMENAVQAMKRGAYDYLTKPFDLEEISILVGRALETRALKLEMTKLKGERGFVSREPTLIGKSKMIREIYKTIGLVANQEVTVLIEGESGTGKELVARAIHFQGNRAPNPFVAVNCSAIPGNLLESELFGAKKGAYTGAVADKVGYFERAHRGTLFLDEIADLPLTLQSKLLRSIQEKEVSRLGDTRSIPVDVRIVAATNRSLMQLVRKGQFREDLYFRLNVVPISLPPLRERKGDIPDLVNFFLQQVDSEMRGGGAKTVSAEAMAYLTEQNWAGNIRELENVIKRACVLSKGPVLRLDDLSSGHDALPSPPQNLTPALVEEMLEEYLKNLSAHFPDDGEADLHNQIMSLMERPLIRTVLKKTDGNQLKASRLLGINRNTLRKKIRDLKIDRRKKTVG